MIRRILQCCLLLLLLAFPARPHSPSEAYLHLQTANGQITGRWELALKDLQHVLGLTGLDAAVLKPEDLRSRQLALAEDSTSLLKIQVATQTCEIKLTDVLTEERSLGEYVVVSFATDCAVTNASSLNVDCSSVFSLDPLMRGIVRFQHNGRTEARAFHAGEPHVVFDLKTSTPLLRQAGEFIWEGIWHIWIGFDHILFLLALLLPSVLRWEQKTWRGASGFKEAFINVLKVVTAFTVAHSITLALAALGLVVLPTRLIESAIAFSVLLAALNNVVPFFHGRAWLVAFGFGLIHGFGFANVLGDVELDRSNLILGLICFNGGVEIGQLAIVAVFLPIAYALRDTVGYRQLALRGGSIVVMGMAAIWMAERIFDFKLLPI